jgi:hypothetical protein
MTSYPGDVPREVLAPGGAARGTRQSPSGTFSIRDRRPRRTARVLNFNGQSPKKTVLRSSIEVTARGAEGNGEGDGADKSVNPKKTEVDGWKKPKKPKKTEVDGRKKKSGK